ncbi:mechanosensitive ion channel family protein [Pseudooceanicola sp. CBS1P-1]|uniref:Mechanosensitive ion channel n=1 Tax=Pseudooceanicola albus TaxID=2692189 RepID=A0A6L7G2W2_9RHOB|nr:MULTISPECIES: mechanosensitive ion channel family protein [Pseudooceanicola]MBT9384630.1 mechanosensitive ion channel family protein [Pseudooceanicola endophyticus]MXN18331.1 mechanosensitive ion channel [Pseudooceanicola albus]
MDLENVLTEVQQEVPPSIWPWFIVILGTLLALGLHTMLWRAVERISRGYSGLAVRIVRRLRKPTRLIVLFGAASLLLEAAALPSAWRDGLQHAALVMLVVLLGWMLIIAMDVWAERFTRKLQALSDEDAAGRKQVTQVRLLQRMSRLVIILLTTGAVLATFEAVRNFGVSMLASAGAAGLVLGLAARPLLANLIAGIQIALTQPIKLEDVVIVEGEWGWIEEIAATYVVVRIWDLRRLVVPLSYFIEKPFQNWTRDTTSIIGQVVWYLDWTAPVHEMREQMTKILKRSKLWDGNVNVLQVIETDEKVIHIRGLVSARNSPQAWDLRCELREGMVEWLQREHPSALPRLRGEMVEGATPRPRQDWRSRRPVGSGVPEEAVPESEGGRGQTVE